jgi:predicted nucleotidyltransferase
MHRDAHNRAQTKRLQITPICARIDYDDTEIKSATARSAATEMGVQQLEQNLSGILANHPSVSLVYLFGSQATGKAGPTSDYDIGVLIDDTMLPHTPDRERFRAQLVHDFWPRCWVRPKPRWSMPTCAA